MSQVSTYWNGEPCIATRGSGTVRDETDVFPLHWARELIGQRVPVVCIEYGDQRFYLYDEGGQGWHKVTAGRGSPRMHHANLRINDFTATQEDRNGD